MKKTIIPTVCAVLFAAAAISGAGQAPAPAAGAPPAQGGRGPAQAPPAHLVEEVQRMYTSVQNNIVAAAEQFPEDKFTWQPTPEVRSWARLIGHLIDDNNGACWQLGGLTERPANVDTPGTVESAANKRTKADLVAALRGSVELCGKAFAAVTPATMTEPLGNRSKIGLLIYNTSHTNEHYGNLVTYMRLQNMVPPSSQGRGGMGGRGRG
jgi:hypothetical protein